MSIAKNTKKFYNCPSACFSYGKRSKYSKKKIFETTKRKTSVPEPQ
jgi:hypothetical protein